MSNGKHQEPTRRRFLRLPVTVLVLILGGALTALALVTYMLYINGTVTVGSAAVAYNVGAGVNTTAGDCSGSYGDDRRLNLTWADPFPDEACTLQISFASKSNDVAMRLQSVTTPAGITGTLGADCGKTLQIHPDPATPAATVDLVVDSGTTGGQVIEFTADTFGFDWVESLAYIPGNCT